MKKRTATSKAAVFLAALVLIGGLRPPGQVFGAGSVGGERLEDAEETRAEFPREQGTQAVRTELTGNIEVSLISAALPSDGFEFQVNPASPFDAVDNPGGQIVCPGPESLKVTNLSVVSVRLEIASVEQMREGDVTFAEQFPGGPKQSFQLVDRVSKVNGFGTALLVLGRADKRYISEADFEQYALYPGRTGIPITELAAGESVGLQLYGTAEADFYGEYQFTVRPILKISAVRAK